MAEVVFDYNANKVTIQCQKNEKMKDIFQRFTNKINIKSNQIFYIYAGNNIVNYELTFKEIVNDEDKKRNKMIIVVYDANNTFINNIIIKSFEIICPECFENSKININEYKISLECKNGHKVDDIHFNEFENMQKIDLSKIKCGICKINSKNNIYNNLIYRCNNCNINICPTCKLKHDKNHNIIDYDKKNYICNKHIKDYNSYCSECNKNLCMFCENDHRKHDLIYFGKIMPNIDELKQRNLELEENINKFKNDIKNIINILNITMENIECYYKITKDIINNYDKKRVNYELLYNIDKINNDKVLEDINKINNENNIYNKFKLITKIYDKIININDEIIMTYNFNSNDNIIRIFGNEFINNNKNNCKIEIDGKVYELFDKYNNKDNKDTLKIKLIGYKNITNLSFMFCECSSLLSLPDISNWNTFLVTNMASMFYKCSSLLSLPDISKWNTSRVIDMNGMFYKCSSLTSLPDISRWNTSNVTNMVGMFLGCSSLSSLPDISKWNTSKVKDMQCMFYNCKSLSSLPDISKWNTSNVTNMYIMFYNCKSLSSLPDISKWNISNVTNIVNMFKGCDKNLNIPSKFKKL